MKDQTKRPPNSPNGRKDRDKAEATMRQKRRDRRAKSAPVKTTLQLGHSLKLGGDYVLRISRKAYREFNEYTQNPAASRPHARKKGTPLARNLTFILFLLGIFFVTSIALMALNNSSVTIDRRTISVIGLPKELEGYTILQISDLHGRSFGSKQTALLRAVNSTSYNLALFTGDMVGRSGDPQPFYDLLEGMTAKRKMFFITGDSDPSPYRETVEAQSGKLADLVLADWVQGAQARGATYLSATTAVPVGQTNLWLSPASLLSLNIQEANAEWKAEVETQTEGVLSGIDADKQTLPFTSYRRLVYEKLNQAVRQMKPDETHIALSHIPPQENYISITQQLGASATGEYDYLPAIDLVLSGHYCGGGWRIPLYGAIYVPNTLLPRHGFFPAQSEVSGLRMLGTVPLYTSPGLSVTDKIWLPNFRLFNTPTITLITLTAAVTGDLLGD